MNIIISQYFNEIEKYLLQSEVVNSYEIIRKDISDFDGKIRIQLSLKNKNFADLFEYVIYEEKHIKVKKYHFHWQDNENKLQRRWDNAPHHIELNNYPHHVHYSNRIESNPEIPDIFYVIGEIEAELNK